MKVQLRRTSEDFVEQQALQDGPEALKLEAEGVSFEDPVKVELTLAKSQDQFICKGRVKARVRLECSRCLAEYPAELGSDLAFVVDLAGGPDRESSEEEGYFVVDPAAADFDIDHLVREAVLFGAVPGAVSRLWRRFEPIPMRLREGKRGSSMGQVEGFAQEQGISPLRLPKG